MADPKKKLPPIIEPDSAAAAARARHGAESVLPRSPIEAGRAGALGLTQLTQGQIQGYVDSGAHRDVVYPAWEEALKKAGISAYPQRLGLGIEPFSVDKIHQQYRDDRLHIMKGLKAAAVDWGGTLLNWLDAPDTWTMFKLNAGVSKLGERWPMLAPMVDHPKQRAYFYHNFTVWNQTAAMMYAAAHSTPATLKAWVKMQALQPESMAQFEARGQEFAGHYKNGLAWVKTHPDGVDALMKTVFSPYWLLSPIGRTAAGAFRARQLHGLKLFGLEVNGLEQHIKAARHLRDTGREVDATGHMLANVWGAPHTPEFYRVMFARGKGGKGWAVSDKDLALDMYEVLGARTGEIDRVVTNPLRKIPKAFQAPGIGRWVDEVDDVVVEAKDKVNWAKSLAVETMDRMRKQFPNLTKDEIRDVSRMMNFIDPTTPGMAGRRGPKVEAEMQANFIQQVNELVVDGKWSRPQDWVRKDHPSRELLFHTKRTKNPKTGVVTEVKSPIAWDRDPSPDSIHAAAWARANVVEKYRSDMTPRLGSYGPAVRKEWDDSVARAIDSAAPASPRVPRWREHGRAAAELSAREDIVRWLSYMQVRDVAADKMGPFVLEKITKRREFFQKMVEDLPAHSEGYRKANISMGVLDELADAVNEWRTLPAEAIAQKKRIRGAAPVKIWDVLLNTVKQGQLVLNPAWYMKNFIDSTFVKNMLAAHSLPFGGMETMLRTQRWSRRLNGEPLNFGSAFASEMLGFSKRNPFYAPANGIETMAREYIGSYVYQQSLKRNLGLGKGIPQRLAKHWEILAEERSYALAQKVANQVHFDYEAYGMLGSVGKRIWPYFIFNTRNAGFYVKWALQNPSELAAFTKARSLFDKYISVDRRGSLEFTEPFTGVNMAFNAPAYASWQRMGQAIGDPTRSLDADERGSIQAFKWGELLFGPLASPIETVLSGQDIPGLGRYPNVKWKSTMGLPQLDLLDNASQAAGLGSMQPVDWALTEMGLGDWQGEKMKAYDRMAWTLMASAEFRGERMTIERARELASKVKLANSGWNYLGVAVRFQNEDIQVIRRLQEMYRTANPEGREILDRDIKAATGLESPAMFELRPPQKKEDADLIESLQKETEDVLEKRILEMPPEQKQGLFNRIGNLIAPAVAKLQQVYKENKPALEAELSHFGIMGEAAAQPYWKADQVLEDGMIMPERPEGSNIVEAIRNSVRKRTDPDKTSQEKMAEIRQAQTHNMNRRRMQREFRSIETREDAQAYLASDRGQKLIEWERGAGQFGFISGYASNPDLAAGPPNMALNEKNWKLAIGNYINSADSMKELSTRLGLLKDPAGMLKAMGSATTPDGTGLVGKGYNPRTLSQGFLDQVNRETNHGVLIYSTKKRLMEQGTASGDPIARSIMELERTPYKLIPQVLNRMERDRRGGRLPDDLWTQVEAWDGGITMNRVVLGAYQNNAVDLVRRAGYFDEEGRYFNFDIGLVAKDAANPANWPIMRGIKNGLYNVPFRDRYIAALDKARPDLPNWPTDDIHDEFYAKFKETHGLAKDSIQDFWAPDFGMLTMAERGEGPVQRKPGSRPSVYQMAQVYPEMTESISSSGTLTPEIPQQDLREGPVVPFATRSTRPYRGVADFLTDVTRETAARTDINRMYREGFEGTGITPPQVNDNLLAVAYEKSGRLHPIDVVQGTLQVADLAARIGGVGGDFPGVVRKSMSGVGTGVTSYYAAQGAFMAGSLIANGLGVSGAAIIAAIPGLNFAAIAIGMGIAQVFGAFDRGDGRAEEADRQRHERLAAQSRAEVERERKLTIREVMQRERALAQIFRDPGQAQRASQAARAARIEYQRRPTYQSRLGLIEGIQRELGQALRPRF